MPMKILIVSVNRERTPFPVAPLGALCVVGAAERAGHTVDFIDMMFERDPVRRVNRALINENYDVVGFGIRNLDNCFYTAPKGYFKEVSEMVTEALSVTEAPVILGGSGFSIDPYGWLNRLDVHYGIVGDGEDSFLELLDLIEQVHGQANNIRGVIVNKTITRDIVGMPASSCVEKLDLLDMPAHSKCDYRKYEKLGGFVSVQTKRGCPFKCIYCVYPSLEGTHYRLRSPAQIAEEIGRVSTSQGVRSFYFTDSVFNTPKTHALNICKEILARKLKIKWMAYCNPLEFDSELAGYMAESGCVGVEFGLDVASKKMLKTMGKPFGQKEISSAIESSNGAGIPTAVHLLFGGPNETVEDLTETQEFLNSCAPLNAVFALIGIRVYKNTPIEKIALKEGVIAAETDLFEPVYYISSALGKDPFDSLDVIARKRPEWSTAKDWARPVMVVMQTLINRFGSHPQWRNVSNYGRYMRR